MLWRSSAYSQALTVIAGSVLTSLGLLQGEVAEEPAAEAVYSSFSVRPTHLADTYMFLGRPA